ncbi:MAG: heterodisulfide reductase-related iron-sulfur binding cluster [Thermodesulfobacteriota bacterium]
MGCEPGAENISLKDPIRSMLPDTLKYSYYPGCSLKGTARDYADSIKGVCRFLGLELEEIPDWNCCGATAAHSIDQKAAITLAGRNLIQAAGLPHKEMLVPCPLCFNRLKTAVHALKQDLENQYPIILPESVPILQDLADFMASEKLIEVLTQKTRKPLEGLKVVCYYGCMSSRPPEITGARDFENPQSLDRIVSALGGIALPWPYKTDCCGASHSISLKDLEEGLVKKILDMAGRCGAQAVVVSCQMCQANLDMYPIRTGGRPKGSPALPVLYFTELIGLALGVKGTGNWLSRHLIDPRPLLRGLGLL